MTSIRSKGSMHSRMLDPSKKKERVFSKSVFKATEKDISDSDSNEKNLYNKS